MAEVTTPGMEAAPAMAAVGAALSKLGTPYRYGAPEGDTTCFDCSSFVQWAWHQAGVSIPRVAAEQCRLLPNVDESRLVAGDLVFFRIRGRWDRYLGVDHVAMYIGGGRIVEAGPQTGRVHVTTIASKGHQVAIARPGLSAY